MDIPGVGMLLHEALHILLLGFIKNHMEDSLNFHVLPNLPRKTVTGVLSMKKSRPDHTAVDPACEQLSKLPKSQSLGSLFLREPLLGEIKWNRSS